MARAALYGYCVIWRATTVAVWTVIALSLLVEEYVWRQVRRAFA